MDKQEEIQRYLAVLFRAARAEGSITKWADGKIDAKEVLIYLNSKGAAIKDYDKIEKIKLNYHHRNRIINTLCRYTEPLIQTEEEKQ